MADFVITDPPYAGNVNYSELADFFYVWLRRSLGSIHPDLFGTVLTPKSQELVATPYRFDGSKAKAERFFERGLREVFEGIRAVAHRDYPVTIYYAFKQTETDDDLEGVQAIASTGWETMLQALLRSGFSVDGTWPMRTERGGRALSIGTNALASSIVLVCRPRAANAGITTRKDFVASLKSELPEALRTLQHGNIAPVDLAQASIGPGMAVFSRYAKVLEPDGSPMRVRTALALINQALDELLAEQEGEFDADTRFAIAWYEQFGLKEAEYGVAEVLTKAKVTSIGGLVEAGIVAAGRGRVRLLARSEYDPHWDPTTVSRLATSHTGFTRWPSERAGPTRPAPTMPSSLPGQTFCAARSGFARHNRRSQASDSVGRGSARGRHEQGASRADARRARTRAPTGRR